jgi:hypothetical protein
MTVKQKCESRTTEAQIVIDVADKDLVSQVVEEALLKAPLK